MSYLHKLNENQRSHSIKTCHQRTDDGQTPGEGLSNELCRPMVGKAKHHISIGNCSPPVPTPQTEIAVDFLSVPQYQSQEGKIPCYNL